MPTTTTFPNGQTLISSALTQDEINVLFQSLTCGCLGIPTGDPANDTAVRIAWQTDGAPAWTIGQDICSIQSTEEESNYNKVRDIALANASSTQLETTYIYTREWSIAWTFRGPNAFDHARVLKSALLLDWTHDSLALTNLYLIPTLQASKRIPELFEGQWWERTDFRASFYEQVTETMLINSVASVEVKVINDEGVQLDFTI